jgi:hypothetical protein
VRKVVVRHPPVFWQSMGSLFWPAAAREVGLVADREASLGQDERRRRTARPALGLTSGPVLSRTVWNRPHMSVMVWNVVRGGEL